MLKSVLSQQGCRALTFALARLSSLIGDTERRRPDTVSSFNASKTQSAVVFTAILIFEEVTALKQSVRNTRLRFSKQSLDYVMLSSFHFTDEKSTYISHAEKYPE